MPLYDIYKFNKEDSRLIIETYYLPRFSIKERIDPTTLSLINSKNIQLEKTIKCLSSYQGEIVIFNDSDGDNYYLNLNDVSNLHKIGLKGLQIGKIDFESKNIYAMNRDQLLNISLPDLTIKKRIDKTGMFYRYLYHNDYILLTSEDHSRIIKYEGGGSAMFSWRNCFSLKIPVIFGMNYLRRGIYILFVNNYTYDVFPLEDEDFQQLTIIVEDNSIYLYNLRDKCLKITFGLNGYQTALVDDLTTKYVYNKNVYRFELEDDHFILKEIDCPFKGKLLAKVKEIPYLEELFDNFLQLRYLSRIAIDHNLPIEMFYVIISFIVSDLPLPQGLYISKILIENHFFSDKRKFCLEMYSLPVLG